ncbi:hypothetical protein CYLTODRAFT_459987 [Cylindrobasidium torrendii FP15055 ss-10]|uniref:Uncharacterized protein n=1 Tax=Cylindrobasidium torrendii FP15055 ss-10 TaxID=1314674 RepID=A0A0D7ATH1_9AGAR|nr:hypothetical protein CYLTODRAFT_459987 [Cylindrobasidium torrendii FP15055 ss-10]
MSSAHFFADADIGQRALVYALVAQLSRRLTILSLVSSLSTGPQKIRSSNPHPGIAHLCAMDAADDFHHLSQGNWYNLQRDPFDWTPERHSSLSMLASDTASPSPRTASQRLIDIAHSFAHLEHGFTSMH